MILKYLVELENLIPLDNIHVRETLSRLLFVKQNLERLHSILKNHIDIKKYNEYTQTNKSNTIAILETTNDLGCFDTVEIIMTNLENLLLIFQNLINEQELIEYSNLIK